jgi:PAS domain S-box
LNKALVRDAVSRQIVGVVTSMQDITAIKQLQQQLSEDEQRFRFLAEESPVPLVITRTSDAALLFSNKAADSLFRGSYAEHAGQSMRPLWGDSVDRDQLLARLQREGGIVRGVEAQFRRFDGTEVWLLLSVTRGRYRDDDALIFAFKDITEAKARESELRNLAYTDTLTGIPNRRYFLARAALELRRAQREGSPFVVLALDIDRFKQSTTASAIRWAMPSFAVLRKPACSSCAGPILWTAGGR